MPRDWEGPRPRIAHPATQQDDDGGSRRRQLEDASKLLVDWGADLVYKSDLTRSMRSPFATTPTRKNKFERIEYSFEEVYGVVLAAQGAAFAEIRSGAKAKDVDAAARKVI